MRGRFLVLAALLTTSMFCFAKADGNWLKKVPQKDRVRVNPYAGQAEAIAAGANIFHNNCAKCHGEQGQGIGSRPTLKSERIRSASDGELAWMLKNGESFKGMPGWGGFPEQARWQIVAFIRSLNPPVAGGQQ